MISDTDKPCVMCGAMMALSEGICCECRAKHPELQKHVEKLENRTERLIGWMARKITCGECPAGCDAVVASVADVKHCADALYAWMESQEAA